MTDRAKDGQLAEAVWAAALELNHATHLAVEAGLRVEYQVVESQTMGMLHPRPHLNASVAREVERPR